MHRSVDPRGWYWTHSEELLATLTELVDLGNRMFFSVNARKNTKPPKPVQIPRPWRAEVPQEPIRKATHEEIVAFFGGSN